MKYCESLARLGAPGVPLYVVTPFDLKLSRKIIFQQTLVVLFSSDTQCILPVLFQIF